MKKFKNLSYDDKTFLAIIIAFMANLIFLHTTELRCEFILGIEKDSIKVIALIILMIIGLLWLLLSIFISVNIIINSKSIFNQSVSILIILVCLIIGFHGLRGGFYLFKIMFLILFFVGMFFRVWDYSK
ncbi:zinc ABC transporter ATPase [Clostridium sp. B9]|uniref:zinc ABC transporter ATPase n=1 Tax=Clostridium sp. B9 TaxID=3423224 RepID=UPI003D2F0B86